ncbi:MAG: hypothetical protein QOJ78_780, partial [Pseudonocardiales bacterium]|nr:hypothetical protein [Pseudonocardiales bacterium]
LARQLLSDVDELEAARGHSPGGSET